MVNAHIEMNFVLIFFRSVVVFDRVSLDRCIEICLCILVKADLHEAQPPIESVQSVAVLFVRPLEVLMCLIELAKLKVRLASVPIELLQLSFLVVRSWHTLLIGGRKIATFAAILDFLLCFEEFDGHREVHQGFHEAPLGHECLASVVENFWVV